MKKSISYNLNLKDELSNILSADFWILQHLDQGVLPIPSDPMKFYAAASVFVKKGGGTVDINLIPHEVKGPCIVNIRCDQIVQIKSLTPDLEASCVIMSKRFTDNMFLLLKDSRLYNTAARTQVTPLPPELISLFEDQYKLMGEIYADTENPNAYQAQILGIGSFFFRISQRCFGNENMANHDSNSRIHDRFFQLVQEHFRTERFLDFYAGKLNISPKHLSRTVKAVSGFSAVDWIDRYIVLEAKVLLKSTNLSVQQIATELNFASQSLFGKYFKKQVGMSPKEFRNS